MFKESQRNDKVYRPQDNVLRISETTSNLYNVTQESEQQAKCGSLLVVHGTLNDSTPVRILFDDGAQSNFISNEIVHTLRLTTNETQKTSIQYGNGYLGQATIVRNCKIKIGDYSDSMNMLSTKLNFDIILGMPWREKYNPTIDWTKKTIKFNKDGQELLISAKSPNPTRETKENTELLENILSGKQLQRITKKRDSVVYLCNMTFSETIKKDTTALEQELMVEFPTVFEGIQGLPPNRKHDHEIKTIDQAEPPFKPLYPLSPKELETLKKELDRLLKLGLISESKSPYGAPIFFVKQKDKLRMVIDYRALNKITVKNRTALPNMDQVISQLTNARYFSKLDLQSGFHQIRIKRDSEHKTAFRTKYGHYEFKVLPFGLANSPATFQSTMNHAFKEYIDNFVVVYIDDILIYSKNFEDHVNHIRLVLETLRKHGFKVNLSKCSFMREKTEFLGHLIEFNSVKPDPSRVQAILDWQVPHSIHELRQFLGLTNTFLKFVPNYAQFAAPLTELLKGSQKSDLITNWTTLEQDAFEELKTRISQITQLTMPDNSKKMILHTDWSKNAIGGWIGQHQGNPSDIKPIAFYSRKLQKSEQNYSPYDGELLSLVENLKHFRTFLIYQEVTVKTDQKALKWLLDQKTLSGRQARWLDYIQEFNLNIEWTKGSWNTVADALSRREHTKEVAIQTLNAITQIHNSEIEDIRKLTSTDSNLLDIIQKLHDSSKENELTHRYFTFKNGVLWYKNDRLCIPKSMRKSLLHEHHDTITGGHRSWKAMYENMSRQYYWQTMAKDIMKYVQTCDICQRFKANNLLKYGKIVPLEIPEKKWQSIGMDFITQLPKTKKGYDSIFVVVDRFTKMAHFIANKTTDTAVDVAKLYIDHIYKLHGLPDNIVSDRDVKFTSLFWKELQRCLQTQLRMSTSRHPQTNGQTERTNQTLEQLLRMFCNYKQDDWDTLLPLVEFTFNNTVSSSTKNSPFFLNYGYHPRTISTLYTNTDNAMTQQTLDEMNITMQLVQEQLKLAQRNYSKQADKKRRDHCFTVGTHVLLYADAITRDIDRNRPTQKLTAKYYGPFEITEQISPVSFRLRLPSDMRIHDVFHVSHFKEYHSPDSVDRISLERPTPEMIDNELEYEVDCILDKKKKRNKLYYLVHWKGYPDHENTWEPLENLGNAQEKIRSFESLSKGDM